MGRGREMSVADYFSGQDADEDEPKYHFSNSVKDLITAIRAQDIEAAKRCIRQGAGVKTSDAKGRTPLWEAVFARQADLVDMFIERGAGVNVADEEGWSLLMVAAALGEAECVRLLLRAGAVADWHPGHGRTPLMVIASGATPVLLPNEGKTVYESRQRTVLGNVARPSDAKNSFLAIETVKDLSVRGQPGSPEAADMDKRRQKCAELLLDRGANPITTCMKRAGNFTALQLAAINGEDTVVEVLLKRRVAMCRSTDGSTALIWAAKYGNKFCCRYLIEAGWDVNESNNVGCTPLLLAVLGHHTDTAEYLLGQGAQVCDATDEFNRNAPTLAAEKGFTDIVDLFNAQSKDKSPKLLIAEANRPLLHRPNLEVQPAAAPFRSVGPHKGGEVSKDPEKQASSWMNEQMRRCRIDCDDTNRYGHHRTRW